LEVTSIEMITINAKIMYKTLCEYTHVEVKHTQ